MGFNSRAREGRDIPSPVFTKVLKTFQFTRPRGARPYSNVRFDTYQDVSIHAPARGATSGIAKQVMHDIVSIHAPARGATFDMDDYIRTLVVSIHAPARGATSLNLPMRLFVLFQFTRPRGARHTGRNQQGVYPSRFQFTRPRGARHELRMYVDDMHKFQFTRPRGARRSAEVGRPDS